MRYKHITNTLRKHIFHFMYKISKVVIKVKPGLKVRADIKFTKTHLRSVLPLTFSPSNTSTPG